MAERLSEGWVSVIVDVRGYSLLENRHGLQTAIRLCIVVRGQAGQWHINLQTCGTQVSLGCWTLGNLYYVSLIQSKSNKFCASEFLPLDIILEGSSSESVGTLNLHTGINWRYC